MFSADYPGALQRRVEDSLQTNCIFMQGASGGLSPNRGELTGTQYGEGLGDDVVALGSSVKTETPTNPSVQARVDHFKFKSRVDFNNPLLVASYQAAFFPEITKNYVKEFAGGIEPELTTALINGELALVGGSGEFFSGHSTRLKERCDVRDMLFLGYSNGHHMYFPTD